MGDENVETMRMLVEASDRGDLPTILGGLDAELEIDDADIPETTGTDSYLAWLARWEEAWESWRTEDLDIRAARDEQVIALFTMIVKGRGSGIELRRADALVASFRAGKVIKLGYYNDQDEALKAVGLAE